MLDSEVPTLLLHVVLSMDRLMTKAQDDLVQQSAATFAMHSKGTLRPFLIVSS